MRVFLAVLVLIFSLQSWTRADDIKDFEIEGMSIGDSLLDYFSEEEILNGVRADSYKYSDRKFIDTILRDNWFNVYESVQVTIKRNDKKYIIYSVDGGIFFERDDDSCIRIMNQIIDDLTLIFKDSEKVKQEVIKHPQDPSGKSTTQGTSFFLYNGSVSSRCYLWSDTMKITNYVAVSTRAKEFNDWLGSYISQ